MYDVENYEFEVFEILDTDFNLSGEDGCINNFDMYTPLYNLNNGYEYLIPYSVAEKWKNGEEVTIYGKIPDEEEMQDIKEFMENY